MSATTLRRVFSTDHKVIGRQYMLFGFSMMLVSGLLAMLMRWQLAFPSRPLPLLGYILPHGMPQGVMLPEFYNALFTMHATVMIFFGIMPLVTGAFANFLVPLQIGAHDMAFPRLNMLSFWINALGGVVILCGFFVAGGLPDSGWTAYPPLSAIAGTGQTFWLVAITLSGIAATISAINFITTILNHRAPGMMLMRMPLTVWSILITSLIVLLSIPVLSAAAVMLFFDRHLGSGFFVPSGVVISGEPKIVPGGGQPLLWQHLFWFFGHPEVYVMILPAMGFVSDILAVFARKPLFGYRAMVGSMSAIGALGFIVWGHHMFVSGMNPLLGSSFALATLVIAVPSGVKTFNWLGTLWGGSIRFATPMLFAAGFVGMFVIGGLSGIFMASTPVDVYIHDTYFIVAHIHYVLFGGSLFAIFAATYFWFPKMFGKMLGEPLGRLHFWLTLIAFNGVMFPMHMLGMRGMPRRIFDYRQYAHLSDLQGINIFMTISAFALMTAQLVFIYNFFHSMFFGRNASANPWEANTLEWTLDQPRQGNFASLPLVRRGPYEYSVPGMERDFLPQTADDSPAPDRSRGAAPELER
jgi:cytochrome c oxidase subunit 1